MHMEGGHMRPEFRLKFNPPKGWSEDQSASRKTGLPIYVPTGSSFANAPALMYVKVTYNSDLRTMDKFVEVAHEQWKASTVDVKIDAMSDERRSNIDRPYRIYHFVNPSMPQQAYELMAYGEDQDGDGNRYFVMIGLSAATQTAIDKAETSFRKALQKN